LVFKVASAEIDIVAPLTPPSCSKEYPVIGHPPSFIGGYQPKRILVLVPDFLKIGSRATGLPHA